MRKKSSFSLVEVIVTSLLVGAVLSMIMTAVVMLDKTVANEQTLAMSEYHAFSGPQWYTQMGYWEGKVASPAFTGPVFNLAPSRAADAQAESLWKEMHELYEQSSSVVVVPGYVIHDFTVVGGNFCGYQGFLSQDPNGNHYPPLAYSQIVNFPATQINAFPPAGAVWPSYSTSATQIFYNRFPFSFGQTASFALWGDVKFPFPSTTLNGGTQPTFLDTNSYRAATVFFLAPPDRILGILRVRAYQFTGSTDPYRYYEVGLSHISWKVNTAGPYATSGPGIVYVIDTSNGKFGFSEDYVYRFAEDKNYPQDLVVPPTNAEISAANGVPVDNTTARDLCIRLAVAGENYYPNGTPAGSEWANNMNPGVSRRQVSLAPASYALPLAAGIPVMEAGVDEWHLILPDPGLGQAEERAALRTNPSNNIGNNANLSSLDLQFRRQGKYGCVLSVYP